ncbi:MAG: hypoxanthine phosphoribosyltransferase [Nitratireductor sp.]|nr:hypoxanthine phosphoribosyltransferase [Nitratireductor sp.]
MPIVRDKKIEVLFSEEVIAKRITELAEEVALSELRNILVISVLKGSFVFAADLIRAFHRAGLAPEVEFISISSYGAGTEAGEIRLLRDIDSDVKGRDIVLIDDILESGNTMKYTRELMLSRGANRVAVITLLDKSVRRKADIEADFIGFECPDQFVVGYGMDVGHAFRELPFVGVVTGSVE